MLVDLSSSHLSWNRFLILSKSLPTQPPARPTPAELCNVASRQARLQQKQKFGMSLGPMGTRVYVAEASHGGNPILSLLRSAVTKATRFFWARPAAWPGQLGRLGFPAGGGPVGRAGPRPGRANLASRWPGFWGGIFF